MTEVLPARRVPPHAKYNNISLLARIVLAARKGISRTDCFKLAGLHQDTGFDWLRWARQDPEKYPLLVRWSRLLERAEAQFNIDLVEVVTDAAMSRAPNTWQAGMTMLERRDPENWGKRDTTRIEAGDKPLVNVQLNQLVLNDDDARELSRQLLRSVTAASPHKSIGPSMGDAIDPGDESA
jgi:hypothetical protein